MKHLLPGTQQVPLLEIYVEFLFLITAKTHSKKDSFTGKVSTFLGKTWAMFA